MSEGTKKSHFPVTFWPGKLSILVKSKMKGGRNMIRRFVAIIALIGMLTCAIGTGYAQAETGTYQDTEVERRLDYTDEVSVYLNVSGNAARIKGTLASISSQYRCELTLSLRKYENSNWNHVVDSWSATGSGIIGASINTQKTGLAAGKYRVHLSGKIYDSDNRLVETVSRDSVQKTVY